MVRKCSSAHLVCLQSRKSIAEMRKDHEDQIQHLKRLKNDEIDVVKSATSQTRCVFFPPRSYLKLHKQTRLCLSVCFQARWWLRLSTQVSHSRHRADGAVLLSTRRALLLLGHAGAPGGAAEGRGGGERLLEGHHLQDAHAAQGAGEAAGEGEDQTSPRGSAEDAQAHFSAERSLGTLEGDGGRGQGRVDPEILGGRAAGRRKRERRAGKG